VNGAVVNPVFLLIVRLAGGDDVDSGWADFEIHDTCAAGTGLDCSPSGDLSVGEHQVMFEGKFGCMPQLPYTPGDPIPPCHTGTLTTELKMYFTDQTGLATGAMELDVTIESLTFTRIPAN
jgi:hypothetical protein